MKKDPFHILKGLILIISSHSRENERQRQCKLFKEIVRTRKRSLLSSNEPQSSEDETAKDGVVEFEHKVAKRYFSELNMIRREAGESGDSSEDENYPGTLISFFIMI